MNCLIIFSVIFSIIIGDVYGKSFDFKQLRKLSLTEKRTVEDVVENAQDVLLDSTPCPVVECLILTDSFFSYFNKEEEQEDYLNDIISATQNHIDALEFNITLRLIGHISYTKETEPEFLKSSLYPNKTRAVITNELISKMRDIEQTPIVERADIIVLITGRQTMSRLVGPGEEPTEINGMAYGGATCNPATKFAIVSDDHHLSWTIDTFIHEVGHLLNIHPEAQSDLKGCSSETLPGEKYSSCSKKTAKEFLDSPHSVCILDNCINSVK